VIRDEHGEVMAAGAGGLTQVRDAFQAEIFACMQGVMVAANKGMDTVILETDSLMLKQAWRVRQSPATCAPASSSTK
jgi:predicted transcriptional regulator